MRNQLRQTLKELENILPKVEREILNKANKFSYSGSNAPATREEAQEIITRYFWQIFCPFYSIKDHWKEHKDQVWGAADPYLRSFGNSLNALDIACKSVEGGLRGVLDELTQAFIREQCKVRVGVIVGEYYDKSSPDELVEDSLEFVREYQDVLPPDKLEHGGAYIRGRFVEVLRELPFILQAAKLR